MYIQLGKKEHHRGSQVSWSLALSTLPKAEKTAECGPHSSGRSEATGEHSLGSPEAQVLILALGLTCCVVTRNLLPSLVSSMEQSPNFKQKIASTIQTHCRSATKPRAATEHLQGDNWTGSRLLAQITRIRKIMETQPQLTTWDFIPS